MALTKITSNVVKDDAVTSAKIVDGGIATADIAANAVTSAKIAQNSILTKHIDDGQVTTDQLGADAVTSAKIADDAISEEHLDVTVITGLTEVTAATGDLLMVADISDSNNLKKIPVSSILAGTHTGAINTSGTISSGAITSTGTITATDLLIDTDVIVTDSTNDRVGINKTSPATTLDVGGSIYFSSILRGTSDGSASSPTIQPGNDGDTGLYRPATNQIGFTTAGTNALTLDASQNATFAGAITSTQNIKTGYNKTIAMDYASSNGAYYKGMTGTTFAAGNTARGLHIFNFDNDSNLGINFWVGTNASKQFAARIDSSQRLLAGVTAPGARSAHTLARTGAFAAEILQQQTSAGASVLGLTYDGAAPNNTTDYFIYAKDTAGVKHLVRANGDGYFAGDISSGAITSTGQIITTQEGANSLKTRFLMGKDSGNTNDGDLYINYGSSNNVYLGAGGGSSDLNVSGDLTVDTNVLHVNSTNNNVGIGDASPPSSVKLAVQADGVAIRLDGSANTSRQIMFRNTTSSNPAQLKADGSWNIFTEDSGTVIKLFTDNDSSKGFEIDGGAATLTNSSHSVMTLQAGTNSSASLRLKNDAQDFDVNVQTNDNFALYNHTTNKQPITVSPTGYMTLQHEGNDFGLQIRTNGTSRSGLVIDKPNTSTILGSALVLSNESYRLGTASHYHMVMLQNGQTTLYGDDSAVQLGVDGTGMFVTGGRMRNPTNNGTWEVRTGGRNGTGTYTLFTNGVSNTQSAGIVEVWGIYGTPSGASYSKYVISGNRSIATIVNDVQTNSVPNPTVSWNGAALQVTNSDSSLYYHVRVELHDIGIGWSPTWGNFPDIS